MRYHVILTKCQRGDCLLRRTTIKKFEYAGKTIDPDLLCLECGVTAFIDKALASDMLDRAWADIRKEDAVETDDSISDTAKDDTAVIAPV